LYECGLCGQDWLHVNRVGEAYIRWRIERHPHEQWGEITEEKLSELLCEPHYGMAGALSVIPEAMRQRITRMLHFIVNEKPAPHEWRN